VGGTPLVHRTINLYLARRVGNFFTSRMTIDFQRTILFHRDKYSLYCGIFVISNLVCDVDQNEMFRQCS
jgi:hypothetical protein